MTKTEFEIRSTSEIRSTDDGKIVGYAAVYNSRSHDLGGFHEVLKPGAFDRTLRENGGNIVALVEHDTNRPLATTKNGTLKIESDERGLRVEIDPADTSYGRDLLALVRRGDVDGMSFRFRPYPGGSSFDTSTRPALRTLSEVELKEVSVVLNPAYPATTAEVRSQLDEFYAEDYKMALRHMKVRLAEAE